MIKHIILLSFFVGLNIVYSLDSLEISKRTFKEVMEKCTCNSNKIEYAACEDIGRYFHDECKNESQCLKMLKKSINILFSECTDYQRTKIQEELEYLKLQLKTQKNY